MKKLLSSLLILSMSISICACGSNASEPKTSENTVSENTVSENTVSEDTAVIIENGQVITGEEYEFIIDSWEHGDSIQGKHSSNSTYSFSPIDHIAYIKMDFKNLSSETLTSADAFGGKDMVGELLIDGNSYPIDTYIPKDIVPLAEGPVYIYYTVPSDAVEKGTEKIATFKIGDEVFQYTLQDVQIKATAANAKEIVIGDCISANESYEFTVNSVSSGHELEDGSGNITYSYSPSDYLMWIELDFKNLGTDTLEEWDCPLFDESKFELIYDEKYEYEGGAWFAQDIPALSNARVFIYFEVPEAVVNETGEKTATFKIGNEVYLFRF